MFQTIYKYVFVFLIDFSCSVIKANFKPFVYMVSWVGFFVLAGLKQRMLITAGTLYHTLLFPNHVDRVGSLLTIWKTKECEWMERNVQPQNLTLKPVTCTSHLLNSTLYLTKLIYLNLFYFNKKLIEQKKCLSSSFRLKSWNVCTIWQNGSKDSCVNNGQTTL